MDSYEGSKSFSQLDFDESSLGSGQPSSRAVRGRAGAESRPSPSPTVNGGAGAEFRPSPSRAVSGRAGAESRLSPSPVVTGRPGAESRQSPSPAVSGRAGTAPIPQQPSVVSAREGTAAGPSQSSIIEGPGLRPGAPSYEEKIYGRTDKIKDWRHQTVMSIFDRHQRRYNMYMNTRDIMELKKFVQQNFGKIVWLDFLQDRLKEVIETFATEYQKEMVLKNDWNADTMIKVVRDIIEEYQRKFALMDVSFEFPETSEGISIAVEKSKRKMTEVIYELQTTIAEQQTQIALMKEDMLYMSELQADLAAARNYIKHLQEERKYVEDPLSQEEFVNELQYRLDMQEHLGSSLREELEQEKRSKEEILEKFLAVESKRFQEHQERMKAVADATRHIEMQEAMREAIIEKIQSLTPDPNEVQKAVNEWLRTTEDVIEEKKKEVYSLKESLKQLHTTIATLIAEIAKFKGEAEEKMKEIDDIQSLKVEKDNEIRRVEAEIDEMDEYYESLEKQAQVMAGYPYYMSQLSKEYRKIPKPPRKRMRDQEALLETVPEDEALEISEKLTEHLESSMIQKHPEKLTPEKRDFLRSSPIPPERFTDEREKLEWIPKDQQSYPVQHENIESVIDSVPLSMQTPFSARDIPAVEITPPSPTGFGPRTSEAPGPSVITPPTGIPFTSKGPAFTYPTVSDRKFKLPPGPYEIITPFRQTVVLTSPKRVEPILVNIGVDPKPLRDTESGECFVCDISLDVQPGGHGLLPQLPQISTSPYQLEKSLDRSSDRSQNRMVEMSDSPVIKGRTMRFDVPPEVTPSSARRYGLFTPKGIFKKGYLNIRRIPGRHPISELPWSPTYLPEEARSPVSPFSPSPSIGPYWSDRTMSWEKSHESYHGSSPEYLHQPSTSKAVEISDSPIIKGPSRIYLSPESDTSPSPVIKGPAYKFAFPESDTSPSPIIKGPTRLYSSPESDISPSPVIRGPTRMYSSPESDTSTSPIIKGPTYRYRSPDSDHSSPSPLLNRTFHRDRSPVIPLGLFQTPPSGYESELDRSRTPQLIRTYDTSSSSQTAQTPDKSISPQHSGYPEDYLNRRWRFDTDAQLLDPLNRRLQPHEMFPSTSISDSSSSSPMNQTFGINFPSDHRNYQGDPLMQRMEIFDSSGTPGQRLSPQIGRSPDRQFSPEETYGSDSMESEEGYGERLLNDSSLLNESKFFR